MTLQARLRAGVPPGELCLEAEVSADPPEVVGAETWRAILNWEYPTLDNRARVCLDSHPRQERMVVYQGMVLFQDGQQLDLWLPYPCVGTAAYPCDAGDTVEMVLHGTPQGAATGRIFNTKLDGFMPVI